MPTNSRRSLQACTSTQNGAYPCHLIAYMFPPVRFIDHAPLEPTSIFADLEPWVTQKCTLGSSLDVAVLFIGQEHTTFVNDVVKTATNLSYTIF